MEMSIALSSPDITGAERLAVLEVLHGRQLALGPVTTQFEKTVARYVGTRYAVAVNSGTSGLHLVVRALGLKEGDEVITTPFSFVASANCLLFERVKPVFVDIDPQTLNIDPERIEERITRKTRAILAVDLFGHPADWPALQRIARRHRLKLIEDSCEALGAGIGGKKCGAFGEAGVFAFYPNKQITTGEGGMIVTDRKQIAESCRSMANQGRRIRNGTWLEHIQLGFNYRLSEVSAALGLAQMKRVEVILARRKQVAAWYDESLARLKFVQTPRVAPGTTMSWFVYVVRLRNGRGRQDRDRILTVLRGRGIQCSDYFRPIHLQPFYRRQFGHRKGDYPICEAAGDRTIALPFHTRMTREDVAAVAGALKEAV